MRMNNSLWSFIFLTIILYETRCAESTKPLEFLSALISKCLEFTNRQLISEIEQAKEENHPIYQINVYEDGEYILTKIENEEEFSNTTPTENLEVITEITTELTTTEKTTTTVKPTTIAKPSTTAKPTTTAKLTTTPKPITTEKITTTEKPTTYENQTTTEKTTTEKPTTSEKSTTIEKPIITVQPRTTVEQVTTIKIDTAVEHIKSEKPIIPIKLGTIIPSDSTSNSNAEYPPATVSQDSYQVPLLQTNPYFYPIPYSNWRNSYPLLPNQSGGYQLNNKYLPYPPFILMANPNIYGSKTLTHNDVLYTETQHQNFGMYYPQTIQQTDYTIGPELIKQWIDSTYGYPNPIYQPYPISSDIAPQMASLEVPSKIALPRLYQVKTMEPTTDFSTKRGHSFEPNLASRVVLNNSETRMK